MSRMIPPNHGNQISLMDILSSVRRDSIRSRENTRQTLSVPCIRNLHPELNCLFLASSDEQLPRFTRLQ